MSSLGSGPVTDDSPAHRPRILVMDDEPGIRTWLRDVLEKEGYAVLEAENGKTGSELYEQERPDAAIIDLFMPVQEGFRTIVVLREKHPKAKLIAISGGGKLGFTGLLSAVKQFGVKHNLEKPFSAAQILTALKELVSKR